MWQPCELLCTCSHRRPPAQIDACADLGFYKGGCPIHLKGASLPRPNYFDPCYRNQTVLFGLRRNSWRQAVVRHHRAMSNPLLSSYSSCFVFTKHPVQLKTVTTFFEKNVLFKKGHLNKRAGVWTPWTPPGSATETLLYCASSKIIRVLPSGNLSKTPDFLLWYIDRRNV